MRVKRVRQPTKAQKWARSRNTSKYRLKGISGNLSQLLYSSPALAPVEHMILEGALNEIQYALECWNDNNEVSKDRYMRRSR